LALYAGDKAVNKKTIIITAATGLVSFAGMFTFAWLTKKTTPQDTGGSTPASQQTELMMPQPEGDNAAATLTGTTTTTSTETSAKSAMTEKQLESLVYEVREKINQYNNKLQELQMREQRLQVAQNILKEDAEKLNNLQVELASTIASLKSERDKLNKSRIEIAESEKNNFISIAATYDKMDAASAGKILTNMSKTKNGSSDDAVKILYYMTDRTKAKLLAELTTSEPALAAYFCQKLKQVTE